jgi:PKHD-type hydroxylase
MRTYQLLSQERSAQIVEAILAEGWTEGKTLGGVSKVKVVDELRSDNAAAKPLLDEIMGAVVDSPIFQRELLSTAYAPRFSRYREGGEYQVHVDSAYMGEVRTDLAMTLFLNDDYEGGELQIELPGSQVARVKAPAGHAVVYECWRPHCVTPVTKGERIVAVTWLQSRVANSEDREILDRLHIVIDDLKLKRMTDQERFAALGAVYDKLYKRFSA